MAVDVDAVRTEYQGRLVELADGSLAEVLDIEEGVEGLTATVTVYGAERETETLLGELRLVSTLRADKLRKGLPVEVAQRAHGWVPATVVGAQSGGWAVLARGARSVVSAARLRARAAPDFIVTAGGVQVPRELLRSAKDTKAAARKKAARVKRLKRAYRAQEDDKAQDQEASSWRQAHRFASKTGNRPR